MIFWITGRVNLATAADGYKKFGNMTAVEDAADIGTNIKILGRYHDLVGGTVLLIVEADSVADVGHHTLGWQSVFESLTVTPALNDADARKVMRAKFGS
ncbi:MAG: DUF3303 family protein [Acidobacteria bacterium]|nr:DUF3303 family protein [Acidobacteriota bacterium]